MLQKMRARLMGEDMRALRKCQRSSLHVWVSDLKITANVTDREEEVQAITGLRIQSKNINVRGIYKSM